jgi:hypothetical protein
MMSFVRAVSLLTTVSDVPSVGSVPAVPNQKTLPAPQPPRRMASGRHLM